MTVRKLRRRARPAALLAALLAAACATPTPYAPADGGRTGYSERQIEQNRYTVSFAGNSLTDRETVETYLLYRAAELTLSRGYDWFLVVQQDTEKSTSYRSTIHDYPFHHHFYLSWYGWPEPFHGHIATETTQPIERYRAVAEIVMHRGRKPADNPSAFDARDVVKHLGPTVRRPEEG